MGRNVRREGDLAEIGINLVAGCEKSRGVTQEFIMGEYSDFGCQTLLFFQELLFCKFFLAADVLDAEIGEDATGNQDCRHEQDAQLGSVPAGIASHGVEVDSSNPILLVFRLAVSPICQMTVISLATDRAEPSQGDAP
jgi:hypothetical protein